MFVIFADGLAHYWSGLRYASKSLSIQEHVLTKAFSHWSSVVSNKKAGLPIVSVYVSEKGIDQLLQKPPISTKRWKKGKVMFQDEVLRDAKIRIRGDNIRNWGFFKKSWKVKLKKSQLRSDKIRTYNLVVPRPNLVRELIPYIFARKVGLQVPSVELVEVLLNGEYYGVMLMIEQTDENFLRNSQFMPVNLYKGEPDDQGHLNGMSYDDLFFGVGAWKQLSKNNNRNNDWSDIRSFIREEKLGIGVMNSRRESDSSLEAWAKFVAFQEAMQSWHNSRYVNQRLIIDDYRGLVLPVVWDTTFPYQGGPVSFDRASLPVIERNIENPEFQKKKGEFLYTWTVKKDIFGEVIEEVNAMLPKLLNSIDRDPAIKAELVLKHGLTDVTYAFSSEVEDIVRHLRILGNSIKQIFELPPDIAWTHVPEGVELVVADRRIYKSIDFHFDQGQQEVREEESAKRVLLDRDLSSSKTPGDLELNTIVDQSSLRVPGLWGANRIRRPGKKVITRRDDSYLPQSTVFRFIGDFNTALTHVEVTDAVTGEKLRVPQLKSRLAFAPTHSNRSGPLGERSMTTIQWSGTVQIQKDTIIESDIVINPGTSILIGEGMSLVFLGKVSAIGTRENPIVIERLGSSPWGSLVVQGSDANNSVLEFLEIKGGSGGRVLGAMYTGMLSLVDVENVRVSETSLGQNSKFDDVLRVVYSKGVRLDGIRIDGALSDAIDFDLSEGRIENVLIRDSGNDGVDLMGSLVEGSNIVIFESGDKGISVGEESRFTIKDSTISACAIGIESKDGSVVIGKNLRLNDNRVHVNAYKKNWRYGAGGETQLSSVEFSADSNKLEADRYSSITVSGSVFQGPVSRSGSVSVVNSL